MLGTHQARFVLTHHKLIQSLCLHQRLDCQVVGMAALQVLQRNLDRAALHRFSRFMAISLVQLRQITGNLRLQLDLLDLELGHAQVLALRCHSLELAAVDGHQLPADQPHPTAELHERAAGRLQGRTVALAKISDGLEVRRQSTQQPHHFNIALALGFQAARRADALK